MGVFRQAPEEKEERRALPVIGITFAKVRKEMDRIDKRIPDSICREIVKCDEPKRRLENVIWAAQQIAFEGNPETFELFREDEELALRFARNPLMFVKLVSATGDKEDSIRPFVVLQDENVGRAFDKNPEKISGALRDIGWSAGKGAGDAFAALSDEASGKLFSENPLAFVEIAKEAKNRADEAFNAIGEEENSKLFSKNPGVFIDVARATGTSAGMAFSGIVKENGELDLESLEFCKALGERGVRIFYDMIMGEENDAMFSYLRDRKEILEFIKSAGKDATLAMYCLLWFGEEKDEKLYDKTAGMHGLGREVGWAVRVRDDKFIAKMISRAKEKFEVFKSLGISFPERYDGRILENVYQTSTGQADYRKKLAIAILNKSDYNGAFSDDQPIYNSLLDHGYNLIICETDNESELLARFFEHGVKEEGKATLALKEKKFDLAIIAGHGTAQSLRLGAGNSEENFLDVDDDELFTRDWRGKFTDNSRIVLMSCSTGGQIEKAGNYQYSMNLMTYLGEKTGVKVFAPRIDTSEKEFIFGDGNRVEGVKYKRDKNDQILNSYEKNKRKNDEP